MSSYTLSKVTQIPYSLEDYLDTHEEEADKKKLAGFLSNTKLVWMTCGPYIEIINSDSGLKICQHTFGSLIKDTSTKIVCVKELTTSSKESTLLAVGLECMVSRGMVCIYDYASWRVLRAIQLEEKVCSLNIITRGDEISSFPGPLSHFDGAIAVGLQGGDIFIIDLCRQALDEARKVSGIAEIRGEIDPCQLTIITVEDIVGIEKYKELAERDGSHLAIHINAIINSRSPHFVLKGPKGEDRIHVNKKEVCISSLHYAPQLSSLFIGFNFGALQIWNLIDLTLSYTSPVYSENIPVSHFAVQEPVDDPRAFCYFWAVYSNSDNNRKGFPLAALYSLMYESKDWHEGYGYIYQNLQSCAVRFQADLSMVGNKTDSEPVSAYCVRLGSFSKGTNRNAGNSTQDGSEESYTLCQMIWNVTCSNKAIHTYLSVFDLNQWYKEQMPSRPHYDQCRTYMAIVCLTDIMYKTSADRFPVIDAHINGSSIKPFIAAQRLEEHYYPNALSFECGTISEFEICVIKNHGMQKKLCKDFETAGPLALMKPTELYEASIKLGLTPIFMDSPSANNTTLVYQREHLLSIALEHRMQSWLCKCATSWGNGSHRAAGLSLDLMLNWAWQRANTLKTNADRLCVSLFDYSSIKLDANAINMLSRCRNQILILRDLYGYICKKCMQFLINPDITNKQWDCLKRIFVYLDVLSWMVNVGLLPESPINNYSREYAIYDSKLSIPYPADALSNYYNERRTRLNILKHKSNFDMDCILYIDKIIDMVGSDLLEKEWKCDGGLGQYPPTSLQGLLRTYLLENVDMELKMTIVTYLLLDLAMMLDQDQYKAIIPTLIKFPTIFQLSPSVIRIIQAFWQLDHGELVTAAKHLCDPMIKSSDLQPWHHKFILETLMLQDQPKLALMYMKVRQLPMSNLDDVSLALSLLIANNMLREAFSLQRQHAGKEQEKLLRIIFDECQRRNQLNDIINLHLWKAEEQILFEFMKESSFKDESNFKSVYYFQRSRFYDFFNLQDNNRKVLDNTDIGKQITDAVTDCFPSVNKQILETCITEQSKLFNNALSPKPMSVFLHNRNEHLKYKADFLKASITKSKETWTSGYDGRSQLTDEDFPFIRRPSAFPPIRRTHSNLKYLKMVDSFPKKEDDDCPTPSKQMKLSPRDSIHTPSKLDSNVLELTRIHTPIILRNAAGTSNLNLENCNLTTTHSILKVCSRRSKTPELELYPPVERGNSTTPEILEDIEEKDFSFINSTQINDNKSTVSFGITPRKSLLRTPVVRFINNESLNNTLSAEADTLNINPLPDLTDTSITHKSVLENKSSTLSTDNETFYSPNSSVTIENSAEDKKVFEVPEIILPDMLNKIEKNPVPGSPKSRRSYKGDTLEVRSSPRLKKQLNNTDNMSQKSQQEDKITTTDLTLTESPEATNQKSFKRVSGRKSLTRKVLENNAMTKMLSKTTEPALTESVTIETTFTKTEITKKVTGNHTEETVDKFKSSDVVENRKEGAKTVVKSHQESSKSVTKVLEEEVSEEEELHVFGISSLKNSYSFEDDMEVDEKMTDDEAIIIDDSSEENVSDEEEEVKVYEDLSSCSGSKYTVQDPRMNLFQVTDDLSYNEGIPIESIQNDNIEIDVTNYADYQEEQEEFSNISKSFNSDVPTMEKNVNPDMVTTSEENSVCSEKNNSLCNPVITEIEDEDSRESSSTQKSDPASESQLELISVHSSESDTKHIESDNFLDLAVVQEECSSYDSNLQDDNSSSKDYDNKMLEENTVSQGNDKDDNEIIVDEDMNEDESIEKISLNISASNSDVSHDDISNEKGKNDEESAKIEDTVFEEFGAKNVPDQTDSNKGECFESKELSEVKDVSLISKEEPHETPESKTSKGFNDNTDPLERTEWMEHAVSEYSSHKTRTFPKPVKGRVTDFLEHSFDKTIQKQEQTDFLEKSTTSLKSSSVHSNSDNCKNLKEQKTGIVKEDQKITPGEEEKMDIQKSDQSDTCSKDTKDIKEVVEEPKQLPAKRTTRSSSLKATETPEPTTPVKTRRQSLRRTSVDSPTPAPLTPTRTLRTRSMSTELATEAKTPTKHPIGKAATPDKPITRTRSASIEAEVSIPKKRRGRAKSVNDVEEVKEMKPVKSWGRKTSAFLPAIEEEDKGDHSKKSIQEYSSTRRMTRRQMKMLQENLHNVESQSNDEDDVKVNLELQSIDPIKLLDKEDFQGDVDPDEEKLLQRSPASSITGSSITDNTRSKRAASVTPSEKSDVVQEVSTPKKRLSKAVDNSQTAELKEKAATSQRMPAKRTRRTSQDSATSEVATEFRRSTRSRTKSDSDMESTSSQKDRRKTELSLKRTKTELSRISEESSRDLQESIQTRGRSKKIDNK